MTKDASLSPSQLNCGRCGKTKFPSSSFGRSLYTILAVQAGTVAVEDVPCSVRPE